MSKPQPAGPGLVVDHPDDVAACKLLFVRALAGVVETVRVVKLIGDVQDDQAKLARLQPGVTQIAAKPLADAARQWGNIVRDARALSARLGVPVSETELVSLATASTEGDVGAIDPSSKMGRRLTEEGPLGFALDAAPGAGIILMGERLALKAIAKLGLRGAVKAGGTFARGALVAARAGARAVTRLGGKFVTPALAVAMTAAVQWFTAAGVIRIVAPGLGSGLGNLLSTPGGLVLGALALYLFMKSRR